MSETDASSHSAGNGGWKNHLRIGGPDFEDEEDDDFRSGYSEASSRKKSRNIETASHVSKQSRLTVNDPWGDNFEESTANAGISTEDLRQEYLEATEQPVTTTQPSKKKRKAGGLGLHVSFQEVKEMGMRSLNENLVGTELEEEDDHNGCMACREGFLLDPTPIEFGIGGRIVVNFGEAVDYLIKDFAKKIGWKYLINEIYNLADCRREAMISKGLGDPGEWTMNGIELHLINCRTDYSLFCLWQINKFKVMLNFLEDHLYEIDPETGLRRVNKKNWDLLLKTQLQIKVLWNHKPEQAFTHSENLFEDSVTRRKGKTITGKNGAM